VVLVAAAVGVSQATGDNLSKARGTIRLTGAAKTFSLDDVRAGRPAVSLAGIPGQAVVLNFFASWCPPCVRELPALQAMAERVPGAGPVRRRDLNDSRDSARSLLDRSGVNLPGGLRRQERPGYDYGIQGMPTTLFIGPTATSSRARRASSPSRSSGVIDRLFGYLPVAKSR